MRRRVKRRGFSKERIIMAASSVMVLGALTAAGFLMRGDESTEDQGYVVDLSEIEKNTALEEEEGKALQNASGDTVTADDLDYDPYFQETNSANVENPDQSESESMSDGVEEARAEIENAVTEDEAETLAGDVSHAEKTAAESADTDAPAISTAMQPTLSFGDKDPLVWPVVGNILINYSMDKTIYFPTLDQYKYNPAIVIQANEGDMITAAAAGKVISVFTDPQIGNAITMDLGNGYEVTYGQLEGILVSEGSYVSRGDLIAQVAAPTKYYSVEGTNVYFKLTKDGEPVNPMTRLN
ncbi:MAG: peptidoglycan DD-metalloendopeptidase family protein [Suilimivivens sp.]